MTSPENDRLRELLRSWDQHPASDPGLADRLQRQVRGARGQRPPGSGWLVLFLASWPRLAVASILLGVGLGIVSAEARSRWRSPAGESVDAYLRWIQPLEAPAPEGQR